MCAAWKWLVFLAALPFAHGHVGFPVAHNDCDVLCCASLCQVLPTQQLVITTYVYLAVAAIESLAVYHIATWPQHRQAAKVGGQVL